MYRQAEYGTEVSLACNFLALSIPYSKGCVPERLHHLPVHALLGSQVPTTDQNAVSRTKTLLAMLLPAQQLPHPGFTEDLVHSQPELAQY